MPWAGALRQAFLSAIPWDRDGQVATILRLSRGRIATTIPRLP